MKRTGFRGLPYLKQTSNISGSPLGTREPLSDTTCTPIASKEHDERAARARSMRRLSKSALATYVLSFAVPLFAVLLSFARNGIYPFGDASVMAYDMPVQYVEFFGWLSNVLNGDGNLWYSANAGLGGGTLALFTYYLSSPLNLICAFWKPEDMAYFFSWLFLSKIPLCSVAMLVYLRGRYPRAFAEGGARGAVLGVAMACAYGLTSYVTGYASNIMWLDGVIMLPIVCLGVHRLVRGRGCALLFASAACAILFNWYTGYIVCFFSVFYFAYELVRARRETSGRRLRVCGRFAATMALAVGASAVLLVPTLLALLGGKGSGAGLSSLFGSGVIALNPIDLASFFTIGTLPGITVAAATPALVISACALVGCCAFFCDNARERTERLAGAGLVGICALAFVLVPLNTAWLGFVPESSYTGRMGFALLFSIAALGFEGCEGASSRTIAKGGAAAFLLSGVATFNVWYRTLHLRPSAALAVAELALIAAFTLLLAAIARGGQRMATAHRKPADAEAAEAAGAANRKRPHAARPVVQRVALVLFAALFAGEQCFATNAQFETCTLSASAYRQTVSELSDFYAGLETDNGFVRTGQTATYTGTSKVTGSDCVPLLLDTGSFDIYSSTQESDIQNLLQHLGYSKVTPFGTYYMSPNTAADALLSVTNIIDDAQPPCTEEAEDYPALRSVYRNWNTTSSLPLAYGIAEGAAAQNIQWTDDPFANQELLYAAVSGTDASGLYHAAQIRETESDIAGQRTFSITCESDGPLYAYCPSIYQLDVEESGIVCDMAANGQTVQRVGGRGSCNLVYVGTYSAGDEVTLSLTPVDANQTVADKHDNIRTVKSAFYDVPAEDIIVAETLDVNEMDRLLARVDSTGCEISSFSDGSVDVQFSAVEDETLVVTIPYEKGWSATVNGREVPVQEIADGLLSIDVSAGENNICLRYTPFGLIPSAAISIASIVVFAAWRALSRRRRIRGN